MAKVASLEIELLANIARLQTDMRNAQGVVERSMAGIRKSIDTVQRAFMGLGLAFAGGAGLNALINNTKQAAHEQAQLAAVLKSTGQAAGFNIKQMNAMALEMSRVSTLAAGEINQAQTTLSAFTGIVGPQFTAALQSAIDMSARTGISIVTAAETVGRSLDIPSQGMASLTRQGFKFQEDQKKLAQQLEATGRTAEAQQIILDALQESYGGAASAARNTLGGALAALQNAFVDLATASGPMVDVITAAINKLADFVNSNIEAIHRTMGALATLAIPMLARAFTALTATMMANPLVLLAVAAVTLINVLWPLIEQTGVLSVAWETMGALFDSISNLISKAFDWIIGKANDFFGLFDTEPDEVAKGLQDPIQQAALVIAGVFDGIAGSYAAMVTVAFASADNVRIAFVNAFNSIRETVSEAMLYITQKLNDVLGTDFETNLWVGPGNEAYRDWVAEAQIAYDAGAKAFGMQANLIERFKETTEEANTATNSAAASVDRLVANAGKANTAYQTLISSIQAKIEQTRLEIATGDKATEADKLRIKIEQDLTAGKLKLSAAQRQVVDALLATIKASESELNISKMRQAAQKKEIDLSAAAVRSLRDEVDKNRDLARTFGMTASAIEDMTAARLEESLVVARQQPDNDYEIEALEKMIALRRENAGLLRSSEARDADIAAWDSWQQEVDQIFQQVGQSLTDAIFEGGKSGRDLVKSLFKTLTLKVLVQPVMNAMQGQVTQALGGAFGAQNPAQSVGASSGGFDFNMMSGGSLGNSLSSFGSTIGSTMVAEFGAGLTAGAGGILTDAGASALMNIGVEGSSSFSAGSSLGSAGLGSALGYLGAIYSATQGQYGSAAGMAIGTAILPGIGTAVGGLIGGLADSLFNSAPKTRHGKTTQYELTAADEIKLTHNEADDLSQDYYEAIAGMTRSAVDGINGVYAQLGIDANVSGFWARTDASKTGKGDGVSSGGGMIVDGEYRQVGVPPSSDSTQFGYGGWSDAPMLPRLAIDLQMTMLEAFQAASGLMPKSLAAMFEGVNIRSLGAEQVQALAESFNGVIAGAQALQAAAEALPFENLKDLSFDAAAGLLALTGNLENLIGLQSSFIDNFYTDAEKQALQIKSISAALASVGVDMPDVTGSVDQMKAAYRALVEAQDVSTEAGQRAYVALLATSGAFAQLAESAGAAAQALATRAEIDQALDAGLKSALDAVTRFGQEEIARLRESHNDTDRAMEAFRSAAQKVQSEWSGLMTALDQGIKSLRAGAEDAFSQEYNLARARISTALVTGQISDKPAMADAVKVAQQGVTKGLYTSQFDQEKAYLILANQLEGLKDIAQPELDTAAATLAQLEDQYALLRGTKKVLDGSLEMLELQVRAAFSAEEAANVQIAQIQSQINLAQLQYEELIGIKAGILSFSQALNEFAAFAAAVSVKNTPGGGGGGLASSDQAYYAEKVAQLKASGDPQWANVTVDDVQQAFDDAGFTPDDHWRLHGKNEGLKRPGFAVGTPFVPYDMAANIHKGEIIIDPRSSEILRRYGIGVQGGGNAEVVAEIRGLRDQNERLEKRLASIEKSSGQLAAQFDTVSAGGNALATEVMA